MAEMALMIAGAGMSAISSIAQGNSQANAALAQKQAADYQAAVLKQQAGQSRATSEAQAVVERRNAAYAVSRARALAGASGTDAMSPDIILTEARIGAQGEYNAASRLYTGEEAARGYLSEAELKKYEGQQDEIAAQNYRIGGYMGAISDLIGGASKMTSSGTIGGSGGSASMADLYGGGSTAIPSSLGSLGSSGATSAMAFF